MIKNVIIYIYTAGDTIHIRIYYMLYNNIYTTYIPVQHALIKKSRSVGQGNRQGTEVGRDRAG